MKNDLKILSPMTTSRWTHRFSSDHRNKALSSLVGTSMGDRLAKPGAVRIFLFKNILGYNWQVLKKQTIQ